MGYNSPMAYTNLLVHCVFSTKERRRLIPHALQNDLWAYMGGIARANGMKALAVGGTADHAHMLLSIPATMPVAKAVQLIKAGSSKWIHERTGQALAWQESYGAFTIGVSQLPRTMAYIRGQEKHHERGGFDREFLAFLRKNGIPFEERYALG